MKILHLLKHTFFAAGNVCAAVDLACSQSDAGHEVFVCSSRGSFDDLLRAHNVTVVQLPQESLWESLVAPLRLYRLLAEIQPHIVHAHMMKSAVLAALLRPILKFGLVTTVHNEFQNTAILMGVGQRVIGVSEAVTQSMIRRGIKPSKMRTVLNGTINSARRPNPQPPALALQRPALITVCGMHPRKGVADLINAYGIVARRFPDARLYLVGSGPMETEYKELARKTKSEGITFFGHQDDPRPYLAGSDIFILASLADPAPLVISEAREAGCAVIASDLGGIPEMLDHGKAGVLVAPGRPDLLAASITDLLSDPGRLDEMRRRSRENVEYFSMDRVMRDVDRIYAELLGHSFGERRAETRAMG